MGESPSCQEAQYGLSEQMWTSKELHYDKPLGLLATDKLFLQWHSGTSQQRLNSLCHCSVLVLEISETQCALVHLSIFLAQQMVPQAVFTHPGGHVCSVTCR